MALSGELHFRLNPISTAVTQTAREFQSFLSIDSNADEQRLAYTKQLREWKDLSKIMRIRYEKAIKHNSIILPQSLEFTVKSQLSSLECDVKRIQAELSTLQTSSDTNLMSAVLQYYSLLQSELISTRDSLVVRVCVCVCVSVGVHRHHFSSNILLIHFSYIFKCFILSSFLFFFNAAARPSNQSCEKANHCTEKS